MRHAPQVRTENAPYQGYRRAGHAGSDKGPGWKSRIGQNRFPPGPGNPRNFPGAPTTIAHRGTIALSINASLQITGFYVDANAVRHGFAHAAEDKVILDLVAAANTTVASENPRFGGRQSNLSAPFIRPTP